MVFVDSSDCAAFWHGLANLGLFVHDFNFVIFHFILPASTRARTIDGTCVHDGCGCTAFHRTQVGDNSHHGLRVVS